MCVFSDQAKQQRVDDAGGVLDDGNVVGNGTNSQYVTLEMRQSRRGTLKSQRGQNGTMRSTASR